MGYAVAEEALRAGHDVTLLSGPVALAPPEGATVVPFVTVEDLWAALAEHFDGCDVLVMAAAVGDFTVARPSATKLHRSDGTLTLELLPAPDLAAELGRRRRADQTIIGFAVEEPADADANARRKLAAKNCDYVVVNTPAALAAPASQAAILARDGTVELPWAERPKSELARAIVALFRR